VVTSPVLAHLSVFHTHTPSALQYFVAPYPLESTKDLKHEFKYLSRYATVLLAKGLMAR
jgi:hypothetical protein